MTDGRRANPGPALAPSIGGLRQAIYSCLDLEQLLSVLATALGPLLPVRDRVSIVFLEPDGEWLRIYRVLPAAENRPGELPRRRADATPVGRVVREGLPQVVKDVRSDPVTTFGHAAHDGIRSSISVPIRVGDRVVGAMNAGSRLAGACDQAMLRPLAEVAAIVGPALHAAEQSSRRASEAPAEGTGEQDGLIGRSDAFRALLGHARRAARSDADVLITGETGVGKTALARAMHRWSPRRAAPFVTVHLADLTSTLIESELFGHQRGAFTGASVDRVGRFESAQGGTILLDEVGEAPLPIQAKLLRVIQDRCLERVGGGRTVEVDVRIIAATSRDLRSAVQRGEFREDLFYRLDVMPLRVPPLRERSDDLEPLVEAILRRIQAASRRPTPEAWSRLRAHAWPGNIRELESVLRRAAIFEEEGPLRLEGFPERLQAEAPAPASWPTLDEHERDYVARVLEHTAGVVEGASGAAKLLGLHPSTLRSLMKRLGLSAQPARAKGRR
jgi:formate hydrogenlyase transcriptional activator